MSNLQPGAYDGWALDTNEYDPDKFYTRSTDGRGNSETLYFKVTPFMLGIMAELVENPEFPDYKTKADVLRDALAHLLHRRLAMIKDPERMARLRAKVEMLMREMETERLKADMQQEVRFTDALIEAMELAVQIGNPLKLAQAIETAEAAEGQLPFHLVQKLQQARVKHEHELRVMKARAAIELSEMEAHA